MIEKLSSTQSRTGMIDNRQVTKRENALRPCAVVKSDSSTRKSSLRAEKNRRCLGAGDGKRSPCLWPDYFVKQKIRMYFYGSNMMI